ncbi:hypothetical protein AC578_5173 [Pseudocercospora eumusae]|uniref:Zn(2)-C6 fungal-type domain-containing protein n=1 Tax=Pseudocercospora eumusae TaxID=321146 RepID=A0A139HMU0_9PEZI|nr:hypothetical protein AC578_5173 [Pseudocercospora eumusae]
MMAIAQNSIDLAAMSRPIERLPVKKPSGDVKEAMNCKSCRKRKIKCNRMKPSCEACSVFNCACIYDAIPKKRGPKTDVLEALLKRVNGLEKRLKDETKDASPDAESTNSATDPQHVTSTESDTMRTSPPSQELNNPEGPHTKQTPIPIEPAPPARDALAFTDALLDTYFARLHNKPYYILDETATRQRLRDGRLPGFLINAIHAVAIRYVPHLSGGYGGAVRSSQDYVMRARAQIDVDEPNIDNLQALLLLAMANFQNGKGKRCYMVLTHAVSMAFALNLHRELPAELRIAPSEREGRRKLFWTCYLMDRFTVSGSKRPSLISDDSIHLRLPAWHPPGSQVLADGNFFSHGSSLPYASGVSSAAQGSGTMLIEIVRVLGVTNRYLAAGGVKGDSHFPWHAQSTLSRIRSDLDYWAAATQEVFTSIDTLFGSHDSSTLVLSKLIYHLVHCLIYRPFLPIDLAELSGSGQHQSWQIEATNLCFLHANAIAELVQIGRNTSLLDWPSFVGHAICTAGTIHVHGAHYLSYREGDAFCHSADFLSREMNQLLELRAIWSGVQHQRDTLQAVYGSHAQLVKSLASSPMRFSPVFQMEDFFDRYPGCYIDGAHVTFSDLVLDSLNEGYQMFNAHDMWLQETTCAPTVPSQPASHVPAVARKHKKRRSTTSSLPYPTSRSNIKTSLHESIEEQHSAALSSVPEVAVMDEMNGSRELSDEHEHNPTLFQGSFTPNFAFSPIQSALTLKNQSSNDSTYHGQVMDQQTPSGFSGSAESGNHESENDPFLSLLEQLAENDDSGFDGPQSHDMNFYLTNQASG